MIKEKLRLYYYEVGGDHYFVTIGAPKPRGFKTHTMYIFPLLAENQTPGKIAYDKGQLEQLYLNLRYNSVGLEMGASFKSFVKHHSIKIPKDLTNKKVKITIDSEDEEETPPEKWKQDLKKGLTKEEATRVGEKDRKMVVLDYITIDDYPYAAAFERIPQGLMYSFDVQGGSWSDDYANQGAMDGLFQQLVQDYEIINLPQIEKLTGLKVKAPVKTKVVNINLKRKKVIKNGTVLELGNNIVEILIPTKKLDSSLVKAQQVTLVWLLDMQQDLKKTELQLMSEHSKTSEEAEKDKLFLSVKKAREFSEKIDGLIERVNRGQPGKYFPSGKKEAKPLLDFAKTQPFTWLQYKSQEDLIIDTIPYTAFKYGFYRKTYPKFVEFDIRIGE